MKEIAFTGVHSGDGESFCFNVNRETFVRIMQREPEECDDFQAGTYEYEGESNVLVFIPKDANKCRIYPGDLFGEPMDLLEIEIKLKTLPSEK